MEVLIEKIFKQKSSQQINENASTISDDVSIKFLRESEN
jgi:hypothetical protein